MLSVEEHNGQYQIPPHELIRAIIYGDSVHFDPDRSTIANIFDLSSLDVKEHFLLPLLVGFLDRSAETRGKDGFVETQDVYDHLQNIGFTSDQVDFAVSRALDKKLIQTRGRQVEILTNDSVASMRVTPAGLYHVHRLAGTFQYIDAIIIDTPILNDSVRDKMQESTDIGDRLIRAERFVKDYLDNAWGSLSKVAVGFSWEAILEEIVLDIQTIRWRLARKTTIPHPRSPRLNRGR
jgi:hypothetical protein